MKRILLFLLLFVSPSAYSGIPFHDRPEVKQHLASGPVIIVNIPEFRLRYYEDGDLKLQSKVILGREDRQTPEMTAEIQHVILNPYWNISNKLASSDIIHRYKKNPSSLIADGYQVVHGWNHDSPIVDPLEANIIECVRRQDCEYRIRQTPGDHNFLGKVKFSMPNPYNVYIHDTPGKHLFMKKKRTFSSGCIRTDAPVELAAMLLGKSISEVERMIATGERQEIYLEQSVKVVVVKIDTPDSLAVYHQRKIFDND